MFCKCSNRAEPPLPKGRWPRRRSRRGRRDHRPVGDMPQGGINPPVFSPAAKIQPPLGKGAFSGGRGRRPLQSRTDLVSLPLEVDFPRLAGENVREADKRGAVSRRAKRGTAERRWMRCFKKDNAVCGRLHLISHGYAVPASPQGEALLAPPFDKRRRRRRNGDRSPPPYDRAPR